MHRMRHFLILSGLVTAWVVGHAEQATANLIKPDAKRSYPDIAADINGKVEYVFDEETQSGVFTVTNTPYLIAGGNSASSEFAVMPTADGERRQFLQIKLDNQGNIIDDPGNRFELYGHIETNSDTFSGLLLSGTPTEFGHLDLNPLQKSLGLGALGVDIFDANIALDEENSVLAPYFGSSAYLRITPELESTFAGTFDEDFTALKATSNTRSYDSPQPFPIPEPTTIAVLLVGGAGLLYRQRRRTAS